MAEKAQQITVEEMFGIAKKFALQLKAFPLETESAIVEMVRVSMQHRSLQEQKAHSLAEMALKERHVAMQESQMQMARMAAERQAAAMVSTGIRLQLDGDRVPAPMSGPSGAVGAGECGPILVPDKEESDDGVVDQLVEHFAETVTQ
jgi:hypothetical protein